MSDATGMAMVSIPQVELHFLSLSLSIFTGSSEPQGFPDLPDEEPDTSMCLC